MSKKFPNTRIYILILLPQKAQESHLELIKRITSYKLYMHTKKRKQNFTLYNYDCKSDDDNGDDEDGHICDNNNSAIKMALNLLF